MEKQQGKAPQIRFPEFKDAWEQKKFGNIFSFRVTNSFSRDKLNYEKGTVKNIHYGDIHTKFSTLFDIIKERVPYINSEIELKKIVKENYCQEGDIVITDASEDYEGVGKSIEIINLNNERLLAGLHTILARPDKANAGLGFFGYYFKNEKLRRHIKIIAQGSKVLSISSNRLAELEIIIPTTLPEQTRIASFFTVLDKKIAELKQKKNLLEQYKKSVMQKLFSQEFRFKDDNGKEFPKWEKKKLGEIAFKNSSNIAANTIEDNFGDYIIYGASGVLKKVNFYREEEKYISIVKDGAGVGRVFLCAAKSSVLGTLDIIKPIGGDLYYLFYFLQQTNFLKYVTGSTIPHIYFSDYKSEKILFPCIEEQTKIANFLSAIDDKINQTENQIQQTQQYKKGLLQKMFCE
jgi:type I restriction enzyme S subunit